MPRHIQGRPRPMNRARAMPVHMTSTMIQPDSVPKPMNSVLPGLRNGMKASMNCILPMAYLVHRWTPSEATAMTPVVRCVDCSSRRWRIVRTSRSVETRPTMIVIESDTSVSTPM